MREHRGGVASVISAFKIFPIRSPAALASSMIVTTLLPRESLPSALLYVQMLHHLDGCCGPRPLS